MTAVLLSPLAAYLAAALVLFGGWRAFQIVSAGYTAKQTERSLHRHSNALESGMYLRENRPHCRLHTTKEGSR